MCGPGIRRLPEPGGTDSIAGGRRSGLSDVRTSPEMRASDPHLQLTLHTLTDTRLRTCARRIRRRAVVFDPRPPDRRTAAGQEVHGPRVVAGRVPVGGRQKQPPAIHAATGNLLRESIERRLRRHDTRRQPSRNAAVTHHIHPVDRGVSRVSPDQVEEVPRASDSTPFTQPGSVNVRNERLDDHGPTPSVSTARARQR